MPVIKGKTPEPAWAGYAFAMVMCGFVFALRFEADHLTGTEISLLLCGLAAVISSIWRAGFRPALAAAAITTAWYVSATPLSRVSQSHAWVHYLLYLSEASVVCLYGRQLRVAKDRAPKGEDWQQHLVETAGEGIWMIETPMV